MSLIRLLTACKVLSDAAFLTFIVEDHAGKQQTALLWHLHEQGYSACPSDVSADEGAAGVSACEIQIRRCSVGSVVTTFRLRC